MLLPAAKGRFSRLGGVFHRKGRRGRALWYSMSPILPHLFERTVNILSRQPVSWGKGQRRPFAPEPGTKGRYGMAAAGPAGGYSGAGAPPPATAALFGPSTVSYAVRSPRGTRSPQRDKGASVPFPPGGEDFPPLPPENLPFPRREIFSSRKKSPAPSGTGLSRFSTTGYRAYSMARVSRIRCTLICPG